MLSNAAIIPIVHVADLARARRFYGDVLGLREERGRPNVVFRANGHALELLLDPAGVQKEGTVLTFEVDDLAREMQELQQRGVRFEPVDIEGARKDGLMVVQSGERAAWLKDSEGNWLCVHDAKG